MVILDCKIDKSRPHLESARRKTDTLSFPSHAQEFGYAGDVLVDYEIAGDTATFHVQLPDACEAACADAYAWALSAFFDAKTWEREPE